VKDSFSYFNLVIEILSNLVINSQKIKILGKINQGANGSLTRARTHTKTTKSRQRSKLAEGSQEGERVVEERQK
jgi:hypothetical protein